MMPVHQQPITLQQLKPDTGKVEKRFLRSGFQGDTRREIQIFPFENIAHVVILLSRHVWVIYRHYSPCTFCPIGTK